jgi:hypothetical protein
VRGRHLPNVDCRGLDKGFLLVSMPTTPLRFTYLFWLLAVPPLCVGFAALDPPLGGDDGRAAVFDEG